MRRKRIRTRRRSVHALAVLLLAAGCGGGEPASTPRPAIERATADRLAATSESIANLLEQGDVCGAAGVADDLRAQVTEAINAGTIPARFQEDLSSKANELVNTVNCPPPAEETEEAEDEGDDEGKGRGNADDEKKEKEKKKKEDEGDDAIEIPVPPIETEGE